MSRSRPVRSPARSFLPDAFFTLIAYGSATSWAVPDATTTDDNLNPQRTLSTIGLTAGTYVIVTALPAATYIRNQVSTRFPKLDPRLGGVAVAALTGLLYGVMEWDANFRAYIADSFTRMATVVAGSYLAAHAATWLATFCCFEQHRREQEHEFQQLAGEPEVNQNETQQRRNVFAQFCVQVVVDGIFAAGVFTAAMQVGLPFATAGFASAALTAAAPYAGARVMEGMTYFANGLKVSAQWGVHLMADLAGAMVAAAAGCVFYQLFEQQLAAQNPDPNPRAAILAASGVFIANAISLSVLAAYRKCRLFSQPQTTAATNTSTTPELNQISISTAKPT